MRLYNTLTGKKEEFKPLNQKNVGLYACGPTVYNYAHIGNLRSYIFSDILRRTLEYNGYKIRHIINITDVGHLASDADAGEDKMMKALKRERLEPSVKSLNKLAEKYTRAFKDNLKNLNILTPTKWTKATKYIKEMIEMIKKIERNGFTYETKSAIYFNTLKLKDYNKLSKQDLSKLKLAVRDEVNVDPEKKNSVDFVLWFKLYGENKNHLMNWPSPWGNGFPGWHIECSAMSIKELGSKIDIHCGGIDHIKIHHTNERAQNIGALGHGAVRFWVHNEFLILNKEKMAKSGDNFITLQKVMDRGFDALAFRYLALNTHYRQQLKFTWEALTAAQNAFLSLQKIFIDLGKPSSVNSDYEKNFLEAINDDLNTPKALGLIWKLTRDDTVSDSAKKSTLLKFDEVLGLDLIKLKTLKAPKQIKELVKEREEARLAKNWKAADELREKILEMGYEIEDTKFGSKIKKLRK